MPGQAYRQVTQTGPNYTGTDFALGADSTLCYAGAGWVCLGLIDTSVSYPPGSPCRVR